MRIDWHTIFINEIKPVIDKNGKWLVLAGMLVATMIYIKACDPEMKNMKSRSDTMDVFSISIKHKTKTDSTCTSREVTVEPGHNNN